MCRSQVALLFMIIQKVAVVECISWRRSCLCLKSNKNIFPNQLGNYHTFVWTPCLYRFRIIHECIWSVLDWAEYQTRLNVFRPTIFLRIKCENLSNRMTLRICNRPASLDKRRLKLIKVCLKSHRLKGYYNA